VSLSIDEYFSRTFGSNDMPETDYRIPDKALHEWLLFGLRGALGF
jgi:hypothetical protein